MRTQPKTFLTAERSLEIERAAEIGSGYHNGKMFAMAGASFRHTQIVTNVSFEFTLKLRRGKCQ